MGGVLYLRGRPGQSGQIRQVGCHPGTWWPKRLLDSTFGHRPTVLPPEGGAFSVSAQPSARSGPGPGNSARTEADSTTRVLPFGSGRFFWRLGFRTATDRTTWVPRPDPRSLPPWLTRTVAQDRVGHVCAGPPPLALNTATLTRSAEEGWALPRRALSRPQVVSWPQFFRGSSTGRAGGC